MEMKNHDFADHDIKDHEKIDDDKSVEDSESTEEVNKDVALRKNTNRIHKTISEEGKKIIVDYMEDWKKERKPSNPFKILAIKLKDSCNYDYNSKAICDYYWNMLDPCLVKGPIPPEERKRICELVEEYLRTNGSIPSQIPWKGLQPKVQTEFGKLRSRNSLKNVWNSNKRRTKRLVKRNDQLAFPINESGTYTKQEKLELRYLLNKEDENDKNEDMDLDK